jgi:hypothetical protein
MSLITNNDLQAILDKLARWGSEVDGDLTFDNTFTAGIQVANSHVMSGGSSLAVDILATADQDVIADLLPAARDLDESNPVQSTAYLGSIPGIAAFLTGLATHLRRYGSASSLDAYLTALNTSSPTLRAHGNFKKYVASLSRGNLFVPVDTVLATFTETGATTGTYVHNAAITDYAGAKLVVRNFGALTTSAVVTVHAVKLDGTTADLTATLSTHTDAHETDLSDTAKLYTNVTGVSITTGTNLDAFKIVAKADRSVAAA